MRYVLLLAAILALGGCGFTSTGDAVRNALKERGGQAMDAGLENTEWFMCEGASVGSVQRRYGKSRETAEAWKTLCLGDPEADILEAP